MAVQHNPGVTATMGAPVQAGRRGRVRPGSAALCALVLLVFAACLITVDKGRLNLGVYRIDLDVYRFGAKAWMAGANLYGTLPPTRSGPDLGFTYPPISAVLMTPLAVLPAQAAGIVITGITLALLMSVVALFLRSSGLADRRRSWRLAAMLLPLAAVIEPVRTTLAYGQINVVLMALVAFDCLAVSTTRRLRLPGGRVLGGQPLHERSVTLGWPRGALVGLAAALKLTPAVFVLYFLARRQWRAAGVAAASFLAVTGIGYLAAAKDSADYWTKVVFDTGRIGPLSFSGNQSLNGVLYRAHLTGTAERDAWLAAALVIGVLGAVAVARAARAGRPLVALALTACTELLVSPVSWSHHWVWVAPALLTAAVAARRTGGRAAAAWTAAGLALFLSAPQWWFPHTQGRELHWGWWEQVIGSSYVWAAIAALVVGALWRWPEPEVPDSDADEAAAALEDPASVGLRSA